MGREISKNNNRNYKWLELNWGQNGVAANIELAWMVNAALYDVRTYNV